MHYPSMEVEALAESTAYNDTHPRRVPPADSPNRPVLQQLYATAVAVLCKRPGAKWFVCDGVQYGIVWLSRRMCVVHRRTHRILVGAPGPRHG